MNKLEEILTGIPQEIKTLEVDTEKKIFKLNGIDFGKGCEEFVISCTGGEGFKIRMELSKRIIYANYGTDNTLESEPEVIKKLRNKLGDKLSQLFNVVFKSVFHVFNGI